MAGTLRRKREGLSKAKSTCVRLRSCKSSSWDNRTTARSVRVRVNTRVFRRRSFALELGIP
jgi:hypothetical protein